MADEKTNTAELAADYCLSTFDTDPIATYRDVVHRYRGGIYVPLDDGQVLHDIREFIATARGVRAATAATVKATFEAVKQMTYLPASLDAPFWRSGETTKPLVMANGLLDVEAAIAGGDNALRPHTPDYFSLTRLPCPFDLSAQAERWMRWILWFAPDEATRHLLAEFIAWCLLLGYLTLQKFLVMVGPGANGKSVFVRVVERLIGMDNVSSVSLERFGDQFALNPTLGKLANIVSDCGELDKTNEGAIKQFVGGDTMYFDRKYKTPIVAPPTAKLIVCCNRLPYFRDRSDGIWRRLIVVRCDSKIEHEQVNLADELCGELAGIFSQWVLPAAGRLIERRAFEIPVVCQNELNVARIDCNPARRFCVEQLISASNEEFIEKRALYDGFREWATRWGFTGVFSYPRFKEELKAAFPTAYETRRTIARGPRPHVWAGIDWRGDRDEERDQRLAEKVETIQLMQRLDDSIERAAKAEKRLRETTVAKESRIDRMKVSAVAVAPTPEGYTPTDEEVQALMDRLS